MASAYTSRSPWLELAPAASGDNYKNSYNLSNQHDCETFSSLLLLDGGTGMETVDCFAG